MNIEQIRELVELYYDGSTTPEQEKELFEYFKYREPTELPEDLREDAEMFAALDTLGSGPPADLLAEVECASRAEKRTRRARIWGWVSAGAAAAVIIVMSILNLPHSELQNNPDTPPPLYTGITPPHVEQSDTVSVKGIHNLSSDREEESVEKKDLTLPAVNKKMACTKQISRKSSNPGNNPQKYDKDGYILINDVETANLIMEDISLRISNAVSKGMEIKEDMPDVDKLLNDILNRI